MIEWRDWGAFCAKDKAMREHRAKFITLEEVAYEAAVLLSDSVPITIEEQIPVFTAWVEGALSESILSRKKNYLKKRLP
jgi:hypothetical protein